MPPTEAIAPTEISLPPLVTGTLLRRYKRFLADVALGEKGTVTAHCPNSGSMKACNEPGRTVFLSESDNPKRKLAYTWELIDMPGSLVGINTLLPNRLAAAAAQNGEIGELAGYETCRREVVVGTRSRIDLMFSGNGRRSCYVEVKNCTLVEDGVARFPDAVTTRGRKHLQELEGLKARGNRAAMLFIVQRMDARRFEPARHIDPGYAAALAHAVDAGVEIMVYDTHITPHWIRLGHRLPWDLIRIARN